MIEKELITLLLKKDFYEENKGRITKEMFTNGTGNLYETISKAHDDSDKDLSLEEVSTLHTEVYNPALTRTSKENFLNLLEEIKEQELPNKKIASNILKAMHKRNVAQKIAVQATEIFNGKEEALSSIQNLLDSSNEVEKEEYDCVTSDIDNLLDALKDNTKWKFNLAPLRERVNGVGEGNLLVIFARPESGKTAFWVNLLAGEEGFLTQGAKVCALINEEPAIRTQMRLINAYTGMTFEEIQEDVPTAKEKWSQVSTNIKILDTVDWTLDKVDSFVAKEQPDIVVIDQLDKVHMPGNFARTDEKLRAIYTGAREIAKRRNCCIIAISQASADASGKLDITFDMMENSKTGKAAEADVIIGVGFRNKLDTDKDLRSLAISKNKITGWHGMIACKIIPQLSRYVE
jgi:replicative DNA helicase